MKGHFLTKKKQFGKYIMTSVNLGKTLKYLNPNLETQKPLITQKR